MKRTADTSYKDTEPEVAEPEVTPPEVPEPEAMPPEVTPPEMITLVAPEGSSEIGHGERKFYPYRLRVDRGYPARDGGGPWLVDVPIEIYHHFIGPAGFYVYEG